MGKSLVKFVGYSKGCDQNGDRVSMNAIPGTIVLAAIVSKKPFNYNCNKRKRVFFDRQVFILD